MITAVVGGQFGSEGKGAIVGHVAREYSIHVRVGAANAGHTFYVDGEKHVVQQLPCAAYASPRSELVLGAGALISEEILRDEIRRNVEWRKERGHGPLKLSIDFRAHIINEAQIEEEAESDLAERIGSTSTIAREGIGQATADRVLRSSRCQMVDERRAEIANWFDPTEAQVEICDTVRLLHARKYRDDILLEGTQGTGLSITTGFFPFCTSRNTTVSGLAADCGLGPGDVWHCIVVMRTYPIRVAGNSGPFYLDSHETTFQDIGVEPETTTVTKLERRVATFSLEQAADAINLNWCRSMHIALTFADYICPEIAGRSGSDFPKDMEGAKELVAMIERLHQRVGKPVAMVGTGPASVIELTAQPV